MNNQNCEKTFGFKRIKKTNFFLDILKNVNFIYFSILIITFFSFLLIHKIPALVMADDKLEYLQKNLKDYALLFMVKDKETSNALFTVDSLLTDYKKWINIIKDKKPDIVYLMQYFQDNHTKLEKMWLDKYSSFMLFSSQLFNFKSDIFSLLWEGEKQKYLILLQNSSEKRPNWWFFGSYAVLDVDWTNIDFQIFDSYYPNYIGSGTYILWPEYINSFWESNKISFIGANKYGITDIDGENIKKVYEKTFTGESIRWIIFVKSDLLEELLPEFKQKFWEWQFVNASVNLIRWKDLPFKKDLYLNDIKEYVQWNKMLMAKYFLQNFDKIKDSGNIRVYLTWVSHSLNDFLKDNNLNTVYDTGNIYLWDYNRGFNKSDGFIDKSASIFDLSWNLLKTSSKDIVDIKDLQKWKYKLLVSYTMNVPIHYQNYIKELEKKFNITLTDREKHILWLNYLWDNEWIIYLPPDFKITNQTWDYYDFKEVKTPFSNNFVYKTIIKENNQVKNLEITFEK